MKIIVGASGGIGSELFKHYSKDEDVIGTFLKHGEESEYMWRLDVTDTRNVEEFVHAIDFYDGRVCLINCVGVNCDCFAHKAMQYEWERVIEVNLSGVFNIIRGLLPYMRRANYGRIINMSSVVAQKGIVGTSAYAASKSGLWGMTKAIAAENAENGITINTLNLGYIDAGMTNKLINRPDNVGGIHNVINAIDFLVNSDFVNGASIDINGGLI